MQFLLKFYAVEYLSGMRGTGDTDFRGTPVSRHYRDALWYRDAHGKFAQRFGELVVQHCIYCEPMSDKNDGHDFGRSSGRNTHIGLIAHAL
jgi:hypothetical protein